MGLFYVHIMYIPAQPGIRVFKIPSNPSDILDFKGVSQTPLELIKDLSNTLIAWQMLDGQAPLPVTMHGPIQGRYALLHPDGNLEVFEWMTNWDAPGFIHTLISQAEEEHPDPSEE